MSGVSEQDRLVRLRRLLVERLGESELYTLCFDLGIDHEMLPGTDKLTKVRELLVHLERRARIPDLIAIGAQLRPDLAWDDGSTPWDGDARAPRPRPPAQAGDQGGGGGVRIGNVGGNVEGNVIAGRDAREVSLSRGSGPPAPADSTQSVEKTPTIEILLELLSHIEKDLDQVASQPETLKTLSVAAPYKALGAQESIRAASAHVRGSPRMAAKQALPVRQGLVEAAELAQDLLGVGSSTESGTPVPVARALGAALPKINLALRWVAHLWSLGDPE